MPEESVPTTPTVNLNTQSKKIEFTKAKFWILSLLTVVLLIVATIGGYFLGQQSAKSDEPVAVLKQEKKEEIKKDEDIKTVSIDEEVTVKSGITLLLTEAKIDPIYEQQKKEQKVYYASQSAYLQSEYFTSSNLILKVSLTNSGKVTTSYNPSGFRLKDSKDNQYSYGGVGEGEKPVIYSLNPGETTKLSLSFTIPETEKKFELIYENSIIEFRI